MYTKTEQADFLILRRTWWSLKMRDSSAGIHGYVYSLRTLQYTLERFYVRTTTWAASRRFTVSAVQTVHGSFIVVRPTSTVRVRVRVRAAAATDVLRFSSS